jgi:heat shock protein HtpX
VKRIFLFLMTNILVMATIMIVTSALGVDRYLTAQGINYQTLAVYCLIWGFAGSFISLWMSKFMAKQMMGVQIVDKSHQYQWLVQRVHQLSRTAGLTTMPEVGIYSSPEVNAFATGPSKSNSLVAVSTGLLERMNDDELEGVLAHEVAHIANGDMVTMTLIQGVINAFVMFFAKIAAFALDQAMRKDDEESRGPGWTYYISQMVFQMVFSILGSIVVMYFSRAREFRADAGAAKISGRDKMIAALRRLKSTFDIVEEDSNQQIACMKISGHSKMAKLFSTHPSLDERIEALQRS